MAKKEADPKKLTAEEVRKLHDEEIPVVLDQLRARMFSLRNQAVSEKIEDTTQFGTVRRAVARVKTERRRRQIDRAAARG